MDAKPTALLVVGIVLGLLACRWQSYAAPRVEIRQLEPKVWSWMVSGTAQATVDLGGDETPWIALGLKVPLDEVSIEGLQQLRGVGPSRAMKISEYIAINGHFESLSDLVHVKGIGPKTVQKVAPFIRLRSN